MSTPPGAAAPAKRDNIFTRKIGPMPMWAWLAIATALLLGWAYYKNKTSPKQSPSNTANASQVPQFVNQTYTTVTPPTAPVVPDKDADKDKDKDSDKDRDGRGDDDKHKKKPPNRRHPTHHERGDDGASQHGGNTAGQQFTPRPGPPTWGS